MRKNYEIIRAYSTLQNMAQLRMPVEAAVGIYNLMKALQPHVKAFYDLRDQRIRLHGGVARQQDASPSFPNQTERTACEADIEELLFMDIDVSYTAVVLRFSNLPDAYLSASDISNLDGFVIFE